MRPGKRRTRCKFNRMRMNKLEEVLERRRVEAGSLQAEVMQKVLGLVKYHERMSQWKNSERFRRKEEK